MKYLCYCQGDILLTSEGHIPLNISALDLQPWQMVTQFPAPSGSGGSECTGGSGGFDGSEGEQCQLVRLDRPILLPDFQMLPLRKTFGILSPEDYRLAGKGAELLYWDQNTKFCGCCGAPMRWETSISKRCTECGKEQWPQVAPAIIVRVRRQDEILLVQAHNFRTQHYGLVAGFVETGESLEECVARELWEETGIRVCNLCYFGSQPWPFPASLMIGFTADYDSGELRVQQSELKTAGWFTRDNLPPIPDKASIARRLIDDWLSRTKLHGKGSFCGFLCKKSKENAAKSCRKDLF